MESSRITQFQNRVRRELTGNILDFWIRHGLDEENGGFIGYMSNDLTVDPQAPKGLILNARLLWTFSAAARFLNDSRYLIYAKRAFDSLQNHFLDSLEGGYFWSVSPEGRALDTKKKIYGQVFVLYGLAEYYCVCHDEEILNIAVSLFDLIQNRGRDLTYGGYFETFNRDWSPADDVRLSDVDMNEKKSMNTHLHVLEAFTNLFRVDPSARIGEALRSVILICLDKILNLNRCHFQLFFDEAWNSKTDRISLGHDIEGSWLLTEAAQVLGDEALFHRVSKIAMCMARRIRETGLDAEGGVNYEADPSGTVDFDKHWWPQAEAVVGFLNAWQITGEECFFHAAETCWNYIEKYIIDHENGEWFWKVGPDGLPDHREAKISEWKSPYHNGRACIEIIQRLDAISAKAAV